MSPFLPYFFSFLIILWLVAGGIWLKALLRKLPQHEISPKARQLFFFPSLVLVAVLLFLKFFSTSKTAENDPASDFYSVYLVNFFVNILIGLGIFAYSFRANGPRDLGFFSISFKNLALTVASYFCFLPFYFLSAPLWKVILNLFSVKVESQQALLGLEGLSSLPLIAVLLGIVLASPMVEELIFRSFLLSSLHFRLGKILGLILSSLLFAAAHEAVAAGPVFVLALFLGSLFQHTSNIWIPFLVHALHNGLVVSMWVIFPELRSNPLGILS